MLMFLQETKSMDTIEIDKNSIKSLNATNLFLVMLSVVTVQVTEANYTHWACVPNPPVNTWVNRGDRDFPMVVNESSWLPSPYDTWGPAKPMEEGKEIINRILW